MEDVRVGNGHSSDVLEVVGCFCQFDTLQSEGVIGDRRWLTMKGDRRRATAKRNRNNNILVYTYHEIGVSNIIIGCTFYSYSPTSKHTSALAMIIS